MVSVHDRGAICSLFPLKIKISLPWGKKIPKNQQINGTMHPFIEKDKEFLPCELLPADFGWCLAASPGAARASPEVWRESCCSNNHHGNLSSFNSVTMGKHQHTPNVHFSPAHSWILLPMSKWCAITTAQYPSLWEQGTSPCPADTPVLGCQEMPGRAAPSETEIVWVKGPGLGMCLRAHKELPGSGAYRNCLRGQMFCKTNKPAKRSRKRGKNQKSTNRGLKMSKARKWDIY